MQYRPDCKPSFVIGQPDGVMIKNLSTQEQVAVCCEFKSTQHLLLPDDIDQVVEECHKALGRQRQDRTVVESMPPNWAASGIHC